MPTKGWHLQNIMCGLQQHASMQSFSLHVEKKYHSTLYVFCGGSKRLYRAMDCFFMSYPVLSHIIFDPLDERWASTYQAILPPPFFIVRRFAKSTEKQFRTVPVYRTLA